MTIHGIEIPPERMAAFCRAYRIRRLTLFGSILRDEFRPESDVDVLVEFEPGATIRLAFFAIERDLSELLGRRVDLNTAQDLSRYFREDVSREARQLCVAA